MISAAKGDPINKIGYKNGLVLGLVVAGIGCLLFYPAAETRLYPLFLGALIVLGAGVTIIQIAANRQRRRRGFGEGTICGSGDRIFRPCGGFQEYLAAGIQPRRQGRGGHPGVPAQTFCVGLAGRFFYVGSEVTVGSILINYICDKNVLDTTEDGAAHYLSFYWGGPMIGVCIGPM